MTLDPAVAADPWAGEKVLVASITTGNRLETYVLAGKPGTGHIMINGGAAHLIKAENVWPSWLSLYPRCR